MLGFTNFDFDEFLRLDLRFVAGGGFGYNVVKNEPSTFDLFGGVAYNKETFDVTPARLVTGIITDRGVAEATRESLNALYRKVAV